MSVIRSNLEDLAATGRGAALRITPKRKPGIHIDMTPMVDVAFLLVIFFMVTALFRQPQILDLEMPPPTQSATLAHSSVMSVKVGEDGRIFWQLGIDPLTEVDDDRTLSKLFEAHAEADPDLVVLVKVDPDAPYRRMVDVLDELTLAKVTRVTAVTLSGPERDEVNGMGKAAGDGV